MTINGFANPTSILAFEQKQINLLEICTIRNPYGSNFISVTFDTLKLHESFPIPNLRLDAVKGGFEIRNLGL